MKTPRIAVLEYELIISKKLFDTGVITQQQFDEVCKIIYEKMNYGNKAL